MSKQIRKCPKFETFQRLNYLHQIRNFMTGEVQNNVLASFYGNLFHSISKKAVIRIDTNVKRRICRKCKIALIPDVSAVVRVKSKNKRTAVVWKCNNCNYVRRYTVNLGKKLWTDRPESTEYLDYSNTVNKS